MEKPKIRRGEFRIMKKNDVTKVVLDESHIPKQWYNIVADMPNKPSAHYSSQTLKPALPEELQAIFPKEVIMQEASTDRFIDIPNEVREMYKQWRPSPLHRARNLEKALKTPARIYYKYEGGNATGSHKLNTAIAQAYYNKQENIRRIATETGAGQWGSALSMACNHFGIDCTVYMVKVSYDQKPHRRTFMQTYGAEVLASPSMRTSCGRIILEKDINCSGSLGIAISEAVEDAASHDDTNYSLGSVLNHVCLHQSIIGLEAKKQLEMIDEYPDVLVACCGGGSNFAGLTFPFLRDKFMGKNIRAIPAGIHAGGLRYHGESPIVSQLYHDGFIEAKAYGQNAVFESAVLFAKTEGIIPAPESSHAIKGAIDEAIMAREEGKEKVILFNLSGHGYFDMTSYERYLSGSLEDSEYSEEDIKQSMNNLPKITV